MSVGSITSWSYIPNALLLLLALTPQLLFGQSTREGVDRAIIDDCQYPDNVAAQALWQPMNRSRPVTVVEIDGRKALHLDCSFANGPLERASWDRKIALDLTSCRGVQFEVRCADPSPVSYFSLYFQSGGGWYHASFFPESTTGWNTIRVDRADLSTEGRPAGWDHIEGIRLSAWRGKEVNTEFYFRDLRMTGVLGADALVAVLRGDFSAEQRPADAGSIRRTASTILRALQTTGVGAVLLSDSTVTSAQLSGASVVVLPRNPVLSDGARTALTEYLQGGGKLLALYDAPAWLAPAGGSGPGGAYYPQLLLPEDQEQQGRALLNLAGALAPDLWRRAAQSSLDRLGAISRFATYEEASQEIKRLGQDVPEVGRKMRSADTLRATALNLLAEQQYASALDRADRAGRLLTEAFCAAQKPEPGEFRGFWCHSAFGVEGIDWDEAIRRLAANGFTAIFPNMLWGGTAYYPSDVLPVSTQVAQRGDQIEACLAACRKYGVQMHVWKVNWNLGGTAPRQFTEKLRKEGRLQFSAEGKEEPWLCPSHPANRRLEVESLLEVVRRYPVDGLHFDYIRFPDSDHCYCPGCRERFQSDTGRTIQAWPQDVLRNGALRQPWLQWRRTQISSVVKAVSERARALRPTLKISAAVFPNWNTERDSIGQDWKLWCEKGYLDFVCPMDYTTSKAGLNNMIANQVQWAGRVPCYPGIGVSATSPRLEVDQTIEQIQLTRKHQTRGFMIFNYGVPESAELLPLLGSGITKKN